MENKLEAMRVEANLGREVGTPWGVHDVMRWDRNAVSLVHVLPALVTFIRRADLGFRQGHGRSLIDSARGFRPVKYPLQRDYKG